MQCAILVAGVSCVGENMEGKGRGRISNYMNFFVLKCHNTKIKTPEIFFICQKTATKGSNDVEQREETGKILPSQTKTNLTLST